MAVRKSSTIEFRTKDMVLYEVGWDGRVCALLAVSDIFEEPFGLDP